MQHTSKSHRHNKGKSIRHNNNNNTSNNSEKPKYIICKRDRIEVCVSDLNQDNFEIKLK